jgi:predicted metal-dependent hydrolase
VEVEVVRSPRRHRTVQARRVGEVLRVSIPATMSKAEEERWVAEMVARAERKIQGTRIDLGARARELARHHQIPEPASIRWVDNQRCRWGSCTPADGSVRISSRLISVPGWVLDYVIVHELAHLVTPRHDRHFWALVNRYPKAERARGYLMAIGAGADLDA